MVFERKVLFYHDRSSIPGDETSYVRSLASMLHSEGCRVSVIGLNGDRGLGGGPSFTFHNVPFSRLLPEEGSPWKHCFSPFLYFHLLAIRTKLKPQIVHIHGNKCSPLTVFTALSGDCPVVFTAHDYELFCPLSSGVTVQGRECVAAFGRRCREEGCLPAHVYAAKRLRDYFRKKVFDRCVDRTIAPSLSMWRTLEEMRIRSHYLPNFFGFKNARHDVSYGRPLEILYIGTEQNGREEKVLRKAFRKISDIVEGVILQIVGMEGEKPPDLLREEGTEERVRYRGYLPDEDVEALFSRASVVVLPSVIKENCPASLLTAMGYGLPVVASRIGGIPELVEDGKNGYLVPPNDPESLAKALTVLLLDPNRARKMGERGKERVIRRFSTGRHVEEILKVYRELLWDK